MSKLVNQWRVPLATSKVALFLLGATLFVTLVTLSSRSAQATIGPCKCAYVTGGQAFYSNDAGVTSLGQQETIRYPDCTDQVRLRVNLSNGMTEDVTEFVSYSSGGKPLSLIGGVYCPSSCDINREFPIYVYYCDPCTGLKWTFTVHLTVF
jgi:hypothetical protein